MVDIDNENERRFRNDLIVRNFYVSLEEKLKAHNPTEFILAISQRLGECRSDQTKWSESPPFRILRAIEACCAFAKGSTLDPVTLNHIAEVVNIFNDYQDPILLDSVNENVVKFFLIMHRDQAEVQYTHNSDDIGRATALFGDPKELKRASAAMLSKYHLTPFQWVQLCFIVTAIARKSNYGLFETKGVFDFCCGNEFPNPIAKESVQSFFDLCSRTPDEIGVLFSDVRAATPLYLHACIRSSFLERPLIKIGRIEEFHEQMVLPPSDLLFRQMVEGPYRLMKDLDNFGNEVGSAFERYVESIFDSYKNNKSIYNDKKIERQSIGESCDFIIELEEEILLIEVKSVSFTGRLITENSIRKDASTTKIMKAVGQIFATANDLASGRLSHLGIDKSKKNLGIVVTLGEIPLVNMDWYFNTFIIGQLGERGRLIDDGDLNNSRPFVISARTLEQMIMICNALGVSPLHLYNQKKITDPIMTGDWDTYINNMIKDNLSAIKKLSAVIAQNKKFMASLGAKDHKNREEYSLS